jgi:hypothetical protein
MPDVPDHRETELAPQDRLATVEPLLPRFLREVLGWDPEDCLVTDGADLFDFACATASRAERQAQVGGFLDRLRAYYLLPSAPSTTRIVDLLE